MASLRASVASFLRRHRSAACLVLVAAVLLGLSESAQGAPERVRRTVRMRWVYSEEALLRKGPQYFPQRDSALVYGVVYEGAQVSFAYRL